MSRDAARARPSRRAEFRWDVPDRFNFCRDTFDGHAASGERLAMWWIDDHGAERKLSYEHFVQRSRRLAVGLAAAGLRPGDVVVAVMPRLVEWWELFLACLRGGFVLSPGTTQLTTKDVAFRLGAAEARAVVVDGASAGVFDEALAATGYALAPRIVVGAERGGWTTYEDVLADPGGFVAADTGAHDPALLFFTSGTTGQPKMTLHTQASYGIGHVVTGRHWVGLEPDDLHWNLSDTGWAKAAYSSVFAPWIVGCATFVHHTPRFDARATLEILERYPISAFCGPPTVYRMLIQEDLGARRFPSLRHCVAAGEPLNPEVLEVWGEATGLPIRDGYGQTETVLLVGNFPGEELRPGSMGRAAPGFDVAVLGDDRRPVPAGEEGEVAVRVVPQRPAGLFVEYWKDPERTAAVFAGDWYLTGDRATRDADGYFWFVGRADDVIISAGYRIGPFEVESALLEHDAVVESAVVGKPDRVRGEIVVAYVVVADQTEAGPELAAELQQFVRGHTAPYKYPRQIEFVDALPKTVSGKIRRIELRARAAGRDA